MLNWKKFNQWVIIAIIIVCGVFWGCMYAVRSWYAIPETAHEFGDSFGMANTLFSALAFAFLIVTALMQRRELELQRHELEQTREELKRSAEAQNETQRALNIQVRIMAKQALLSAYKDLMDSEMVRSTSPGAVKNRNVSRANSDRYFKLMERMTSELENEETLFDKQTLELIKAASKL